MPNVVRQGDVNEVGGAACSSFANTIITNGRPTGRIGTLITPHECCGKSGCDEHCHAIITTGSPNVIVEGIPIARITSLNSCGHTMVTGSGDVISS